MVVDNLENGDRTVLGLMPPVSEDRIKINDLYLRQEDVRRLALSSGLTSILVMLLGDYPALCNSLYLEKGTQQESHVDSLYMTPRTPSGLIASWVALEDTHADSGQLEYYPKSHLIPPMVFSDGSYHAAETEMADWRHYMEDQIKNRGLQKTTFSAKRGDVSFGMPTCCMVVAESKMPS